VQGRILVGIAGLLGAMLWVLLGLATRGIPIRLAGDVALREPPGANVRVELALPQPISVELAQPVAAVIPQPLTVEANPGGWTFGHPRGPGLPALRRRPAGTGEVEPLHRRGHLAVPQLRPYRPVRAPVGEFRRAMLSLPTEPWSDEPFLFVLVFPAQGPYAWLCTPGPQYLPDPLPVVHAALVEGIAQAFGQAREVRGSGDDLYPLLLSIYLQRLGLLVGVN